MDEMRKNFTARVKAVDREKKQVTAIVSAGSIDRDDEVILPSAFERRLPEYRKNPVLLWGHPLSSWETPGPERCIGKALDVQITSEGLQATFQYAVDENPTAKMVFDLVAGGYIRAYSVGCIIHGVIRRDADEQVLALLPDHVRQGLASGDVWRVYSDVELIEISQVFVGSNRDALIQAAADGIVSQDFAVKALSALDARDVLQRLLEPTVVGQMKSFTAVHAAGTNNEGGKPVDDTQKTPAAEAAPDALQQVLGKMSEQLGALDKRLGALETLPFKSQEDLDAAKQLTVQDEAQKAASDVEDFDAAFKALSEEDPEGALLLLEANT